MSLGAELLRELLREVLLAEKKKKRSKSDLGGRPRKKPDTEFAQWVDSVGGTEEAASMTDTSVPHINKLARLGARPSMELASEIQKVSSGKVDVDYWVDNIDMSTDVVSARLLREFVKLALESAPSRLKLRAKELSADSTGYETSHLDQPSIDLGDEEEFDMAQHLKWGEMLDPDVETDDLGPVPPNGMDPRALPDPFIRGQYDNVTWER